MSEIPESNDLIALRDVPSHLPRRNGKKTHYSTVYRWMTKGARGRVLESRLLGGVRYTTRDALSRFLDDEPRAPEERQLAADLKRALYGGESR